MRSHLCLAGMISILVFGLLLTGCGKKSFPKPASVETPPEVRDLRVQVRAKGVELTWTIPDQLRTTSKNNKYRFNILRSELLWNNRNCLDCPGTIQQELQLIDPAYPDQAIAQDNRLSWTDPAVSVQHAYRYQVLVQDKNGRPVTHSNPAIAKVFPPPGPITNLMTVPGPQGILIQWKPPTKDAQGQAMHGDLQFLVERFSPNKTWEKVSAVPVKANNFLDQGIAAENTYGYRVTSMLMFEETPIIGETSTTSQAKAPEALPPPPPNTVWAIPSKGAVEVQWTESEAKVSGYYVYRREGKEIIRLTANPVLHPPYVDQSVKPNAVYFYAVSSVSLQPDHREGLLSKWAEIRSLAFEK